MTTAYVIRPFCCIFTITWVPVIPPPPNANLYLRRGTALVIATHGTATGATRSGTALMKVRGA